MREFDDSRIMETPVSSEHVFDGLILHIDHVTNRLPDGRLAKREVARHIGAAAAVPVDAEGNVTLVRQFRSPFGRVLMEIPAGKLDAKEEDHREAAERELAEETGLAAAEWTHLIDLYTTVGFSDECISIYLATGLTPHAQHLDEDEFLGLVKLPLSEALEMVYAGEIPDSKTAVGLMLAERALRQRHG